MNTAPIPSEGGIGFGGKGGVGNSSKLVVVGTLAHVPVAEPSPCTTYAFEDVQKVATNVLFSREGKRALRGQEHSS